MVVAISFPITSAGHSLWSVQFLGVPANDSVQRLSQPDMGGHVDLRHCCKTRLRPPHLTGAERRGWVRGRVLCTSKANARLVRQFSLLMHGVYLMGYENIKCNFLKFGCILHTGIVTVMQYNNYRDTHAHSSQAPQLMSCECMCACICVHCIWQLIREFLYMGVVGGEGVEFQPNEA